MHAVQVIAREEGLRGFYRGMLPHMIRVVPNSAIIFCTYELLVQVRLASRSPSSSLVPCS
jgi:hypothetical protein